MNEKIGEAPILSGQQEVIESAAPSVDITITYDLLIATIIYCMKTINAGAVTPINTEMANKESCTVVYLRTVTDHLPKWRRW